ncbi:MAG: ABC transporter ATP-binding protein [Marinilabiliaceae bacterium]
MKTLAKYVRPLWPLALLSPLCVLVETWSELSQPALMARIVDDGILAGQGGVIPTTGAVMAGIMVLGVACGIMSIYAAGRVAYGLGASLRSDIYRKVSRLAFADIDRLEQPSLITRLGDDVGRVQSMVQQSMRLLFRAPLMFFGSVAMALMIDTGISLIIVGAMAVALGLVTIIMSRTYAIFKLVQTCRDKFTGMVQEILLGIRVVKTYTNESLETARYGEANSQLTEKSISVGKTMAGMMPAISFALNAGTILVIYVGAGEVETGGMKVGGIMAAINYIAQIQIAIMMAQHVIMGITQARASMERIKEVLNTPTEDELDEKACHSTELMPFTNGDIELRDVSFSYTKDGNRQLRGISLQIAKGSTVAIMGETGSGKTTLAYIMARLYEPDSGTVTIGGTDIRRIGRADLQRHVGMVLQTPQLFSGTLRENLGYGRPDVTEEEIMEAARIADIADFIGQQPNGLDYMVSQGGQNLSGGQRQRLCIARMIVMRPDIIILDDSLSALDSETEKRVRQRLVHIEATKIIISQRVSTIRNADCIVVIKSGRIEAQGSHDTLMSICPTYRETFESQTR